MNFAQVSQSDFFGKDGVTAFIGQVEDVNDPKHAGRVRVRCVGWHPAKKEGEDGLKTEELPWARVGSPTTHAQTGRVGGKHGLLVGSWVYGVMLDGQDGNQPFVLTSFPMTAKAVTENNKQPGEGEATLAEGEDPFGLYIQNKNFPNTSLLTKDEKGQTMPSAPGDPNGSLPSLDDSDSDCDGEKANQSAISKEREEEMKKGEQGNLVGQVYEVTKADGRCGPAAHAQADAKKKMKEQMPSQAARFLYNDKVYNNFTGSYMNLNGMLMSLAFDLCQSFKFPAQANKAEKEKNEKRTEKSARIIAQPDRDGAENGPRQMADRQTTQESDEMHAAFQESFIDLLCQIIMQMLQAMQNGGGGGNQDGEGADGQTPISDWEAECLSAQLTNNIFSLMDDALAKADEDAREKVANGDGGGGGGGLSGIMSLLMQGLSFAMKDEYTENPEVFNTAGNRDQDKKNKEDGCNTDREFSTLLGSIPSFGGGGGGGGGGDRGGYEGPRWEDIGFGGSPGGADGTYTDIPCEDSTIPKVEDPGYDDDGTPAPYPPASIPGVDTPPVYVPGGGNGVVIPLPLPSEGECAQNFIDGRPNTIIVTNPGKKYYFNNNERSGFSFPNIYINGYKGKPVPVVDRVSGEIVAVITACSSWSPNPRPIITIEPGESEVGIVTDDPNYDINIIGFHIANTGFGYCDPQLQIYDRDAKNTSNGKALPVVREGRIVDVIVVDNGTGFKRIPEVKVFDSGRKCGTFGGNGAKIYPIMQVVPKDRAKTPLPPVEAIYCPGKNSINALQPVDPMVPAALPEETANEEITGLNTLTTPSANPQQQQSTVPQTQSQQPLTTPSAPQTPSTPVAPPSQPSQPSQPATPPPSPPSPPSNPYNYGGY